MTINAILAVDSSWGIGKDNALPWPHCPEDMQWFKQNTNKDVVFMGRKTWESLGNKALPNRQNVVLSNNAENVIGNPSWVASGDVKKTLFTIDSMFPKVWVIGGGEIYRQALPCCENVYLTKFHKKYDCDTYFDKRFLKDFTKLSEKTVEGVCTFYILKRNSYFQVKKD